MNQDDIMYQPLDLTLPTEEDKLHDKYIEELLVEYNSFPTEEETKKRQLVLSKLHELLRNFVKIVSMSKAYSEEKAEQCGSMLVTSGSFRLGVHGPGSDIDAVCIVPSHVTKDDFFNVFYNLLKNDPLVSELNAVPDAHVPVIKLFYDSVDIDLLFAPLPLTRIDEDGLNILDESLMDHCDQATQRSLNGPRVAIEMLQLVENKNFRLLVRCIKKWAKSRGIYGNALSFPGGIAWALMCAKICQWYPNASVGVLLKKMFQIYSQWQWPKPITLKRKYQGSGLKIWDPQTNPSDKYHLMPVITPSYPSMNSTYNITKTTLRVLTEEFIRGKEIVESAKTKEDWKYLFADSEFFVRFKNYLQIKVSAASEAEHRSWEGFVGSRIRFLIKGIEQVPHIQLRPFPEWFLDPDAPEPTSLYFIGVSFTQPQGTDIWKTIFDKNTTEFSTQLQLFTDRTEGQRNPKISQIKRSSIPRFVLTDEQRKIIIRNNNLSRKRTWRQVFEEDSTLPQFREQKRTKLSEGQEESDSEKKSNETESDKSTENGNSPKPNDSSSPENKNDQEQKEEKKPKFRTKEIQDDDDDAMLGIPTRLVRNVSE